MSALQALNPRQEEILALIVRAHIASGAPVASAAVARNYGGRISPATVRNEMAALEEAGYLSQPHTSAGRVPTGPAFEFYAENVAARARLLPADQRWINRHLAAEEGNPEALLLRAPHVLSVLCHAVGLALAPPLASTALRQIRFVPLDRQRVLVVLVTRGGLVRDKVVQTRQPLRADELDRMSAFLNENYRGWTLEAIRREMERRVASERNDFLRQALALCRQSFEPADERSGLHLEGVAHLVGSPGAEDPEEWRELLEALEERERLAQLLADCIESPDQPVRVLIGLEKISPAMKDFALIGTRFGRPEGVAGSLGLLGRTRMDYDRAVTAIAYVAEIFDRLLTEN